MFPLPGGGRVRVGGEYPRAPLCYNPATGGCYLAKKITSAKSRGDSSARLPKTGNKTGARGPSTRSGRKSRTSSSASSGLRTLLRTHRLELLGLLLTGLGLLTLL